MSQPDISSDKNAIVRRMFFETADLNYISARAAFFDGRDWDFWWLSLHATEKYLKATLLTNGRSAKGKGHDLTRLITDLKKLDARITEPDFSDLSCPPGLFRTTRDPANFMRRITEYGSPDNRYGTYGYQVSDVDLPCVDRLIYWARRYARPFSEKLETGQTRDWVGELADSPDEWRHFTGPLEETLALKPSDRRRWPAARGNLAFLPRTRRCAAPLRTMTATSPINQWCSRLCRSEQGSDERQKSKAILKWVIDNIQTSKQDLDYISKLVDKYP